ncbi:UPF0688 protein C1orf174 homolog [Xenopus laevis]|uniref:UPF0688 protein C1orf174 homolog n=1 Tax=Xenopus laevis TaxID=8355 RepID=A0A8J1L6Z7_XENLA|nr:UPF0688 protein C1orf174 homolog [Xenopus laevis]
MLCFKSFRACAVLGLLSSGGYGDGREGAVERGPVLCIAPGTRLLIFCAAIKTQALRQKVRQALGAAVSSKNTDKKSPKKLENDEKGLMESDEQELISKTDNIASNESNAGNVNTCPSASPFSDLNEVSRNGLTDDREDGVGFSHKTSSEPSKVREVYLNGSPFVDEDSNQPMPLGLFLKMQI